MSETLKLGVPNDYDHMLNVGVIDVYATGGKMRVARIINPESKDLLGYGLATSAEEALHLARMSSATRDLEGHDKIDFVDHKDIYDEFRSPLLATDTPPSSALDDYVVSGAYLRAERDGEDVLAWSMHLGRDNGARAQNLQAATAALLEQVVSTSLPELRAA